jgi:hypothetical protein
MLSKNSTNNATNVITKVVDKEKSNTKQHLEKLVYILQHNSCNQKCISMITQTQGM